MSKPERQEYYRWQHKNLLLYCHIQANTKLDQWQGQHGNRLKIRISAQAFNNQANKQLIKFIARQFAVARTAVKIISGTHSNLKSVCIEQPRLLPIELAIKQP